MPPCRTATIDPIVIGAQIVTALQTDRLAQRRSAEAVVVSVTKFNAGTAHNIIPEQAMSRRHRAHAEAGNRDLAEQRMQADRATASPPPRRRRSISTTTPQLSGHLQPCERDRICHAMSPPPSPAKPTSPGDPIR
jgi:hypothetical protein